jgi:DNA-binding YbaB/EbfC family protein
MIDMNKFNELLSGFQEKAKEMDAQSESTIHTAKSGGGLIEVSANGKGEVVDIIIDDTLLEDKESLQILLMSAINDVYKNVEESRKSAAMSMLGDMGPFGQQ